MDIIKTLAQELEIRPAQAEAAVKLIDEGNTVPFISRYRKEATGSLNDEVLRKLLERLNYLRNLEEKKKQVLSAIEEQGKLTTELKRQIEEAATLVLVDDLYRPFRPKRRTRATIAKEKGLEPLANLIWLQMVKRPLEEEAADFLSDEKEVHTAQEAIAGACDILAESISDEPDYRTRIREMTMRNGFLVSEAKDETAQSVYEMYYQYRESIAKTAGYRVLALNRGEKEKIFNVRIEAPEERILQYLERKVIIRDNPYTASVLKATVQDAYRRLIAPAIEREIRNDLTEKAQEGAISVFGKNLEQLLMQPPIAGQVVLGWDPAFRTGCKLAVVDETGKVLDTTVVYPTAPTNEQKIRAAKDTVKKLIQKYGVTLISVGNGTASRESEQIIVEILKEIPQKVSYVITNEAGASVYSASKLATEEFPNFDVGQRSAASIARRVQDPLAELVKIDPKSIGVGQYQHDMNQKKLGEALDGVVEDCVNRVGVDLNTASAPLMEHISGITKTIARNIVAYREENGRFQNRKELLKVPKLGPKAFEQCAGFMRITGGTEPLDATSIHPESYEAAGKLLESLGIKREDFIPQSLNQAQMTDDRKTARQPQAQNDRKSGKQVQTQDDRHTGKQVQMQNGGGTEGESRIRESRRNAEKIRIQDYKKTAAEIGVGEPTLRDIVKEFCRPGRDPREEMPKPILRTDVLEMKDLKEGMILKGTVRNVIDFGTFVDIGVHQDGLVHISQLTDKRFVKRPLEVVSVGDIVEVKVLSVDLQRKRIGLTMRF